MEKQTKKLMKKIKVDLKKFKKTSETDQNESLKLIAPLKKDIKTLLTLKDIKEDEKITKKFNQLIDGLTLYVNNINDMEKFKKKWE